MAKRCLGKVLAMFRKEHPGLEAAFARGLVEEAVEEMALQAAKGKLRIDKSPTLYLKRCCDHKFAKYVAEKKNKPDEIPFSVINRQQASARSSKTTQCFVNSLIAPGRRPEQIALERELLRKVGEQVGGLPPKVREVIACAREGLDYPEIAQELDRSQSTVRVQFWDGVAKLRGAVHDQSIADHPRTFPALDSTVQDPNFKGLQEFVRSIQGEFFGPFFGVHFEGYHVGELAKRDRQRRAKVESILLHVYWTIRYLFEKEFPTDYLPALPRKNPYPGHKVDFNYW